MLTPLVSTADLAARQLVLSGQASAAYAQHAHEPGVSGTFEAYLKRWAAGYEARNALAELNPVWAQAQLPTTGPAPVVGTGLPLVPAGVLAVVDAAGAAGGRTVTLTVDVAGLVSGTVLVPGAGTPDPLTFTPAAGRATVTFPARVNGIYRVQLLVGSVHLATLYVLVCRDLWSKLREWSRATPYGTTDLLPRPAPIFVALLARLAAAAAACRTSQPALAERLLASARALPAAPSPTAIPFGSRHGH